MTTTETMMPSTYTATWDKDGSVIYKNQPHGNLFGQLPYGSLLKKFPGSAEDEWDGAQFELDEETLTVRRDRREARPADPREAPAQTVATLKVEVERLAARLEEYGQFFYEYKHRSLSDLAREDAAQARVLLARLEMSV